MEKRKRMTLTEIDRVPDFGVVQSDSDVDREILFKQANTLRSDMRSIIGVLKAENAALKATREEIVRETVERCVKVCDKLSAGYSDRFAVVMAESIEENRTRLARMETCGQIVAALRAIAPAPKVQE